MKADRADAMVWANEALYFPGFTLKMRNLAAAFLEVCAELEAQSIELADARAGERKLIEQLEAERELHLMKMVAVCTASGQNTDESRKQRIEKSNPYWSPAYEDVCAAVDREIAERKAREELLSDYKKLQELVSAQGIRLMDAEAAEARLEKLRELAKAVIGELERVECSSAPDEIETLRKALEKK